jgi:hypothetical protein
MIAGVYTTLKKNKETYYRTSVTYRNKHISLGSFSDEVVAGAVYQEALAILSDADTYYINPGSSTTSYNKCHSFISFEKFVILINFRDHHIYFKTPIYLGQHYFLYFLNTNMILRFDVDDLFYYANHKIMSRGGYLYVNDYGMQTNILSRYGIKNHAVLGRDYIHINGDDHDYRYQNLHIINRYQGVTKIIHRGFTRYRAKIHIQGDFTIGTYTSETEAAIAYNKAVDMLSSLVPITYQKNYIEDLSDIDYAKIYNHVRISSKIRHYQP